MKKIRIALAGNPNVGKTTIFNHITGAKQHVGNWPGVTVEKKVGYKRFRGHELEIIDLPGTYSLSPYSIDEVIARDYIIEERPDVVVHVVDATNMERNLYFTTQLMEHEARVVIALNMFDLATSMGDIIDIQKLSEFLEIPIIPTTGSTGEGIEELLEEVISEMERGEHHHHTIGYGQSVEKDIGAISRIIERDRNLWEKYPTRWLATKLLEGDQHILDRIKGSVVEDEIREELSCIDHEEMELLFTDKRYEVVGSILSGVLKRKRTRISRSDMMDHVLTNKYLGIPIFLALMWGAFELTFSLSVPFMDIIDAGFSVLRDGISNIEPTWLASLLGDGIVGGVGFVIIFVPVIFILFFLLSLLEGSGYLARAAFIMDRLMYRMGLQGKSFIPMLMGFGCNVPAIMATRSIDDKKGRLITILVNPFISCGARLPVYILLAGVFFERTVGAGTIIFIMYATGILLAILSAKLLRITLLKGEPTPFIMELPPYRIPDLRSSLMHMWDNGKQYLRKAGTIIFAASIIIWVLSSFNMAGYIDETSRTMDNELVIAEGTFVGEGIFNATEGIYTGTIGENVTLGGVGYSEGDHVTGLLLSEADVFYGNGTFEGSGRFYGTGIYTGSDFTMEESFASDIGHAMEPVTRPLGFDWKMNTGLIFGFAAKEIVVSTLGVLEGVGDDDGALSDVIANDPAFSPLIALSFMFFVLIYTPCAATVAVIKKETGSWKWAGFSIAYSVGLAWTVSFIVYQAGSILGY